MCDKIVSGEVTRDELLEEEELEADSTTEEMSPVKKSKVLPSKGKNLSKEKSTKGKNPMNKKMKQPNKEKKLRTLATIQAIKKRAREMFSPPEPAYIVDSSGSDEESEMIQLKKQVASLQQQLQSTSTAGACKLNSEHYSLVGQMLRTSAVQL